MRLAWRRGLLDGALIATYNKSSVSTALGRRACTFQAQDCRGADSEQELEQWLASVREAQPDLKVWRQGDPISKRAESDVQINQSVLAAALGVSQPTQ